MSIEKSIFDEYFQNDKHGQTTGILQGTVTRVYHDEHRVDVDMGQYDQPMVYIQYLSPWSGGPNAGIHALPRVGASVNVIMRQGKSYGMSQGIAFGHGFTKKDFPAPSHPGIAGKPGVYALQMPIAEGEDISPGSIEYWDDKGAKHSLLMAKGTHQSMGMEDARAKGISMTESEKKGLDAMNAMAVLNQRAGALADAAPALVNSAEGLQQMSQEFLQLSSGMDGGHRAMSESARSFGRQLGAQADAMGLAKNAAGLASGVADFDTLE